jgi:hypothetical protein
MAVLLPLFVLATVTAVPPAWSGTSGTAHTHFATAAQAVEALIAAVRAGDKVQLAALLGPQSKAVTDAIATPGDAGDRDKFVDAYNQHHALSGSSSAMTLTVGTAAWAFPVPLRRNTAGWFFDGLAGRHEMLARVIGDNEMTARRVCIAIADAERDYAAVGRDGRALRSYTARLASTPDHQDGLYWPTKEGQPKSPIGPFLTEAPTPYHGYTFRILTAQGPHAAGGAYSYMIHGELFGGFAVIASPALYGLSGIETFLLGFDGTLYEKDLGPDTIAIAARIERFDPDVTWKKVEPPK